MAQSDKPHDAPLPSSASPNGGRLALTFDDRHIASWVAARPLWDAAGARVTFFVVEADLLDEKEASGLRTLIADGHSVGSHGARHRNADETIAAWGGDRYLAEEIDPSIAALRSIGASAEAFAYPNSRRDATTDAELFARFSTLRGGGPRSDQTDSAAHALVPPSSTTSVFPARGVDTGRGTHRHPSDEAVLSTLLRTLAAQGGTLVLYAHDIARRSAANHIDPERLAGILTEARRLGLQLVGFDELSRHASAPAS